MKCTVNCRPPRPACLLLRPPAALIRCLQLKHTNAKHKGKRKRDADFLDVMKDMDEANRTVLQQGQGQRDQYMSQAEDAQDGFLSVLGQLVQLLSQRRSYTATPLD